MEHAQLKISSKDLKQWDLLAEFRDALARCVPDQELHPTFQDPKRKLEHAQYLSLYLLGLLNPVIKTMRALCSASQLERVQRDICGGPVSLGSFSEAQHLVNSAHLERVFGYLNGQIHDPKSSDPQQQWGQWFARDSSLFRALPRMAWALYGGGRAGSPNQAARLHLSLHLMEDTPEHCQVTPGQLCERKSWKEQWEKGAGYVGDRYFSKNFKIFEAAPHEARDVANKTSTPEYFL